MKSHKEIDQSPQSSKTISLVFRAEEVESRQVIYEQGGGANGMNVYIDA